MYPHCRDVFESYGLDDFLALSGRDQWATPASTGLLVPLFLPGVPYLFMGCAIDLVAGDSLVGMREMVSTAKVYTIPAGDFTANWPVERYVETPGWHLPGGFVTFIVTAETKRAPLREVGPHDMHSFLFEDADAPALLYETAGFPGAPIRPGYLGLNAYTPPAIRGQIIHEIRDVQDPWTKQEFGKIDYPVERPTRIRAYIQVMQTFQRPPNLGGSTANVNLTGLGSEDRFWEITGGENYWRVGVSLLTKSRCAPRKRGCSW